MEVAQIKVLLDNNFLHFILKYSKPYITCKKESCTPTQHAHNNSTQGTTHTVRLARATLSR